MVRNAVSGRLVLSGKEGLMKSSHQWVRLKRNNMPQLTLEMRKSFRKQIVTEHIRICI